MRTHSTKPLGSLLIAGLLTLPSLLPAQPSAHYVPGSEGLDAATLPPPGWWLRDYNLFYNSKRLNDSQGNQIPLGFSAFTYAQVPRVLWITDTQVLGGNLGVDALLPFVYNHAEINALGYNDSTFGMGDFFAEGSWSQHSKHFDTALAFGVWAPTGDSGAPISTRAGQGFWTYMFTAGATWHVDDERKWSVSALNRYEFNMEDHDTEQIPGQAYTLEWGVSREIAKGIDIGAVGYYQQQVTPTTSPIGSIWSSRNRVAAVGPEISAFFPQWMLGVSFRYEYEFMAENRAQGQTFTLTITKKF